MTTDNTAIAEEEVEEVSLRDALEGAIEEHDPEHELIPASSEPTSAPVQPEGADTPGTAQPKAAEPSVPKTDGTPPEVPSQVPASQELKAPAQWKPAAKELWNQLPRAIQEEVHRREGDSMRLIGSVGPKIRIADEVAGHMQPFSERLQSNNISPSAFIGDVFNSIKALASGNPQAQAEVVANIVQSYGVDVRQLDAVLTKRLSLPPEVYQAREMAARANAVLYEQRSGVEQQSALEAERALAAFAADPKHEFLGEVRELMADLIDSGRAKNLEDAYAAAVWANADTRKVLLQREAQTRATSKTNRAVIARKASSSVHGTPSLPGPAANNGSQNLSLRDEIASALDEHSSL